jgi:hypothetical protein
VAEVEYEPRDANVRAVVKAAIALGALSVVGAVISFGAYAMLRNVHRAHDPKAAPLAPRPGRVPPMPRLQNAPTVDMQQLRAEQLDRLSKYGWQNQQMGTVHIPIEEAMKLYVERAATAAGAATDAPAPTEVPAAPAPASSPRASPPGGSPR